MIRILKNPFFVPLTIVVFLIVAISIVSIRLAEHEAARDNQGSVTEAALTTTAEIGPADMAVESMRVAGSKDATPTVGNGMNPVLKEYLESDNWFEFLQKYWDRAQGGEIEPMVRVYEALNTCRVFQEAIRKSESREELESKLRVTHHETDVKVGLMVFERCKPLVTEFNQFPDWERLKFQAALAGHPQSKARMVVDYYSYRKTVDREDVPFSPAEFLIEALASHEPEVFAIVGGFGKHNGMLVDTSDANTYGWKLLSCRFGLECDTDKHLRALCTTSPAECEGAETLYDYYRNAIGEDAYIAAEQRADVLHALVLEQRWDDLGVNFIW